MGSVSYNFLSNSILFDEKEINGLYPSLTDSQLEYIIHDYRQHCIKNMSEILDEASKNKSSLKVMSSIEKIPIETIKQGALYFDQFIIQDPLFQESAPRSEISNVLQSYLGIQKEGIDRKRISEKSRLLKSITPMVAADFVRILPLSKLFEPPQEIPIFVPYKHSSEDLPKELLQYCSERAVVKSLRHVQGGMQILEEQDFTPGILIKFKDYPGFGLGYNYFRQEFLKTVDSNRLQVSLQLADYPMDKKEWETWVYQSVNRSAKRVIDKIYLENLIANEINASYLTDNLFTSNLLIRKIDSSVQNNISMNSISNDSATQFMNIKLPFLDKVDIDKLMKIRTHESNVFTNFRIELERQFRELRLVKDPYELKLRHENIIHELAEVQVKRIHQKFKSLKRKGVIEGALLTGGLVGTVQTAGWSLLASALAMVSGYKSYQDYKDNLVDNPSYLLWKILK